MVQANPDASLRPRRPRQREERFSGDSGEERFPGSGRSTALEGGVCGSAGPKGLRGEGPAGALGRGLVEHGSGASQNPWVEPRRA